MEKKEIIIRILLFVVGGIMLGTGIYAQMSWKFNLPEVLELFLILVGLYLTLGSAKSYLVDDPEAKKVR